MPLCETPASCAYIVLCSKNDLSHFFTYVINCTIPQSECLLPGTARPGLEVPSPYIQQPLDILPLNSAATAITHATLDGFLFLFAATENGSLVQVSSSTHQDTLVL